MRRIYLLFICVPLLSACLKSDALDQGTDVNFLRTDFYLNDFENFNFEILEVDLYEPQGTAGDSSYLVAVKYKLDPVYMDKLFENWDYEVEMIYQKKNHKQKIVPGKYEYSDTLGRFKKDFEMTGNLEVLKVFRLIATTSHTETVELNP